MTLETKRVALIPWCMVWDRQCTCYLLCFPVEAACPARTWGDVCSPHSTRMLGTPPLWTPRGKTQRERGGRYNSVPLFPLPIKWEAEQLSLIFICIQQSSFLVLRIA